jgi:hypothetical protein
MLRSSPSTTIRLLLGTMLGALFFSTPGALASPTSRSAAENIDQIEAMIRKNGAQQTVHALYDQDVAWDHLRENVAKGQPRWLKVGATLYGAADGGAKQMLAHSLAEALIPAAARVMTLASQRTLTVTDVCIGPDVDDDRFSTYEAAATALHQTIASVQRVTSPELQSYKEDCLRQLAQQESSLSTFFHHSQ